VVEQRTQSFTIELNGSVSDVTPFFGPVREAEWAPDWSPHFIHPAEGVQREGVVFTTSPGHGKDRLWLLTTYDVRNGRVEYVVVTRRSPLMRLRSALFPTANNTAKQR
jgi:hypothetical protein